MPRYTVNATVSFAAWLSIDADSPEEATEIAQSASAGEFDYDSSTGEVEFNVTPEIEVESA